PVHCFHHRLHQSGKRPGELPEFFVIWALQKCVVEVANEMNQAFLLRALYGIVRSVEIRHQNPYEIPEHVANGRTLAGRSIKIGDVLHAGENPDVAILAFDADAGLVNMQQGAFAEPFQEIVVCALVSMRNYGLKSLCGAAWDV